MRAWVYTRNSSAAERSVEEQEAESRAVCDREGWQVERVVTDLVGASRHSKGNRVGWQAIRKALADGDIDVLVTWECSRANRDLAAYAELRDLCVKHGALWNYSGKTYDMRDGDDRFRTGLDALLAEREAEETSNRVQRAMRANATSGKPHGRRLYGYQRTYDPLTGKCTGQEPHPTEAPVVRSIFADFLAGIPIYRIGCRLNDDGIRTRKGTPWRDAQIRNLLRRESYCARRVHQGEVVGRGAWEPLVSEEVFDRTQARLTALTENRVRTDPTARMLTGVARCGKCGGRTWVGKNRGRPIYHCTNRGCGGVGRDLAKLEAYVSGWMIETMQHGGPFDAPEAPVSTEADDLRARIDAATDQFVAGKLTAGTLAKIEAQLLPRIAELDKERRRAMIPLDLELPEDGNYERWWHETLTHEQRRAACNSLISSVTILPTHPGRRTFDPDGVDIAAASVTPPA